MDEALEAVETKELETPTPDEMEAMDSYIEYGNEWGFEDCGEHNDESAQSRAVRSKFDDSGRLCVSCG